MKEGLPMRTYRFTRIGLLVLAAVVAVTAIPGSIWVVPTMPLDWIKAGPFTDWTVPAIALGLVGIVAAFTFVLLLVRPWAGALASVATGAAIVTFELVEVGVVGWTLTDPGPSYFQSWLQSIYLVVGSIQVLLAVRLWLGRRGEAPRLPLIHPAGA
jgi:hypothetical protein